MEPQRKFLLLLLVGLGIIALGFGILQEEWNYLKAQALIDPHARAQAHCIFSVSNGCVTWPYIVLPIVAIGLLVAMSGGIGIIESRFPREGV